MSENSIGFLAGLAAIVLMLIGYAAGANDRSDDAFNKFFAQHIKDPTKCTNVCHPPGYEGAWPDPFPADVTRHVCEGKYCAKASHEPPGEEENEDCKQHITCSSFCSEVCCVCLRECI